MTPSLNEPAEREAFQSYWCPPDHDETRGFEVHEQFARDAWLARARIAAEREAELVKDAERLQWIAQNAELVESTGTPGKEKHNLRRLRKIVDAALAPETGR